jgi:hypothetical protein
VDQLFLFGGFATTVPLLTSFMATFAPLSTSLRAVGAAFLPPFRAVCAAFLPSFRAGLRAGRCWGAGRRLRLRRGIRCCQDLGW